MQTSNTKSQQNQHQTTIKILQIYYNLLMYYRYSFLSYTFTVKINNLVNSLKISRFNFFGLTIAHFFLNDAFLGTIVS